MGCEVTDLRDRIAKVADAHTAMGYDSDYGPNDSWVCNCGCTWTAGGTHGEHVADVLIRELKLTRESAQDGIAPVDDPPVGQHRYVTEWTNDE